MDKNKNFYQSEDLKAQILEIKISGKYIFVNLRVRKDKGPELSGIKKSCIVQIEKDDLSKQIRKFEVPDVPVEPINEPVNDPS